MSRTQEIFDRVRDHMLAQNARSTASDDVGRSRCAYRGDGGLKCALGCLITDEHYAPSLEGLNLEYSVPDNRVRRAVEESLGFALGTDEVRLLVALQQVHDRVTVTEDWLHRLALVAATFGLKL